MELNRLFEEVLKESGNNDPYEKQWVVVWDEFTKLEKIFNEEEKAGSFDGLNYYSMKNFLMDTRDGFLGCVKHDVPKEKNTVGIYRRK